MRAVVAVRLAIRPRLRLSPEPPAASRRRRRLPAFALPAAVYWLAMAGLTYVFAHLGPNPLEQAFAAERERPTLEAPSPPSPSEREPASLPAPSEPVRSEILPSPASPPVAEISEAAAAEPASSTIEQIGSDHRISKPAAHAEPPPASEPALHVALPTPSAGDFPEFTDSSPARARERGADGPRIDGLFEPQREAPTSTPRDTAAAPSDSKPEPRHPLTSCEAAIARNNEQLDVGAPRGPADITREAYASILQNGRYLADCRVPERTVVEICAAVKQGRAVGVTVVTSPPSASLAACVRSRVAGLAFPNNERLDVTHTRFDAAIR